MYATIIHCDMHAIASAHARGQMGRTLATALAALPGFIAFVALDADTVTGAVAALCIFEEQTSIAPAARVIAQWQHDALGAGAAAIQHLGTGAVIAQKGL
jgi:hypothetical protein